jgi:hypothetical protein
MDKAHSELVDWTINYLKNRDLFLRKIDVIEKDKKGFDVYVKFKDSLKSKISNSYESPIRKKEQFFVVMPIMSEIKELFSRFEPGGNYGLVVFNTLSNFNVLIDNWKEFVKFKGLCVYFVNPSSKLDKRWVIYPYTHNNICEEGSLKAGLKSMFDMVEVLTEAKIKDTF